MNDAATPKQLEPADAAGFTQRLAEVEARIASAAAACGRDPGTVRLLGVSKTFGPEAVAALHAAGLVRFGISIPGDLIDRFDALIDKTGYANRSEAIRDLIRNRLVDAAWEAGTGEMIGTFTMVYDHQSTNSATPSRESSISTTRRSSRRCTSTSTRTCASRCWSCAAPRTSSSASRTL